MKGSLDIPVGYTQYTESPSNTAFFGNDSQNDESPTTDWTQCQANARTMFRADTTLGGMSGGYGADYDYKLKHTAYDFYGARFSSVYLGGRIYFNISNNWKINGQKFTLRLFGGHSRKYNTGAPTYQWVATYNDYGRIFFKLSESDSLFSSGANIQDNFGTEDFYVDALQFNNATRARGVAAYNFSDIYVDLDKTFIQSMVGNSLYIWFNIPYWYEAYWAPTATASISYHLQPIALYTYY